MAKSAGCGSAMPPCGREPMKRTGLAGSASRRIKSRSRKICARWPTTRSGGFQDVLLLGMGGSSLCPEVLRMTYGKIAGRPELHVLDSTDPAQIKSFRDRIDPAKTLFIVSSKSGSTLEPNIFKQYFFDQVQQAIGAGPAGSRFIAITDPGSKLQEVAEGDRFRHVFFG